MALKSKHLWNYSQNYSGKAIEKKTNILQYILTVKTYCWIFIGGSQQVQIVFLFRTVLEQTLSRIYGDVALHFKDDACLWRHQTQDLDEGNQYCPTDVVSHAGHIFYCTELNYDYFTRPLISFTIQN